MEKHYLFSCSFGVNSFGFLFCTFIAFIFFQGKIPAGAGSNCDNIRFMERGGTIDLLTSKTNSEIESESESNDSFLDPTGAPVSLAVINLFLDMIQCH